MHSSWTGRNTRLFIVIKLFLTFWIGSILISHSVYADWSYSFVVNKGNLFIVSDVEVDAEQIGSKIGKVTTFSDQEGTYSGNFSNRYQKGTEYYKIKNTNLNEAIAVKESEGIFKKANYGGPYAGSENSGQGSWSYVMGAILLILILYAFKKLNFK